MKKIKITPPAPADDDLKPVITKANGPVVVDEFPPPLDAAAQVAAALKAEAAALDGGLPGATEAPGEAEAAEAAAPVLPTYDMLRPLFVFVFDVFAPNWKISPVKIDALTGAYAALADKYYPDGIGGRWAEEINAAIITVAIFQPLMKIPPRDAAPAAPTTGAPETEPGMPPPVMQ